MELRQLRYFVRVVELGSMGRAALELGVVTSALSQQLSRLEGELATRLLHRSAVGVRPTDAGMAFYKQAQLALRHADDAIVAAQQARLSGHVSVGLASSTSTVIALPFVRAMRERYPEVKLRLVESLSGNLGSMLNARQLDLAILFDTRAAQRWSVLPLLDEAIFLIGLGQMPELRAMTLAARMPVSRLAEVPLVLPSSAHGLRAIVDSTFAQARLEPRIVLEVDGLAVLMDAVSAGIAATIQPGAAVARLAQPSGNGLAGIVRIEIADTGAVRRNVLASLSEDELSPAALAARLVLRDVARALVADRGWPGATLHES